MAEDSLLGRNPDVAEVNRSGWKLVVTIVLPAFFAAGSSYLFLSGHLIWSAILLILFINLFALQAFFLKSSNQIWGALWLSTVGMLAPFYSTSLKDLAIAALITMLFFVIGIFSGRHELNNTLKISFSRVARKAMVGAITGMAAGAVVLGISGSLGASVFSLNNISQYVVDPYIVGPSLEYGLHQQYMPNETVNTFLTNEIASSTLVSSLPAGKFKDQAIAAAVTASAAQLQNTVGSPIDLNQSISLNMIEIGQNKINQLGQPTQLIAVLSLYLLLWSAVAFLATLASYLLSITAFIIFEILVMSGFAEIQMESRTHEMVTLQ